MALKALEAVTGARPVVRLRPSLDACADSAGYPRILSAFARPGDVVKADDPERLGVVVENGQAAFVGPHGLIRAPLTTCTIAWTIG